MTVLWLPHEPMCTCKHTHVHLHTCELTEQKEQPVDYFSTITHPVLCMETHPLEFSHQNPSKFSTDVHPLTEQDTEQGQKDASEEARLQTELRGHPGVGACVLCPSV